VRLKLKDPDDKGGDRNLYYEGRVAVIRNQLASLRMVFE
jgi:hypothetical protein